MDHGNLSLYTKIMCMLNYKADAFAERKIIVFRANFLMQL